MYVRGAALLTSIRTLYSCLFLALVNVKHDAKAEYFSYKMFRIMAEKYQSFLT